MVENPQNRVWIRYFIFFILQITKTDAADAKRKIEDGDERNALIKVDFLDIFYLCRGYYNKPENHNTEMIKFHHLPFKEYLSRQNPGAPIN